MANIISFLIALVWRALLPFFIVFATALPGYIILRLYPTLLNYNNETSPSFISFYIFMLFFGSSIAFLLNDFLIGPCITIVGALVVECISLIIIYLYTLHPSDTRMYWSVGFTGFPIGILQSCIAAFFGDRYTSKLIYSQLNHFHCYLVAHFAAYGLPIYLIPLYYPTENYGICVSSICHRTPLYIAIGCTMLCIVLVPFMYWGSITISAKISTIPATMRRMALVLTIFIPFVLFWMYTFAVEHLWIIQGLNMFTKYQRPQLDSIRALIIILCIPIVTLFRVNEVLRMLLGGILIIVSVICSSFIGNFEIHPFPNITKPNHNIVQGCNFYTFSKEVDIFWGHDKDAFKMTVPRQQCRGPFLFKTEAFKDIPYSKKLNFKSTIEKPKLPAPGTPVLVVMLIRLETDLPFDIVTLPDRISRSSSTLPMIRQHSASMYNYQKKDKNLAYMKYSGGNTPVHFNIALDDDYIREIPEGQYKLTGNYSTQTVYFRSGGYYQILYYPTENTCNTDNYFEIKEYIRGYISYNIYYQALQYILFGLGKMLIFSSGLDITYALGEKNLKCSLIGIFWGIYYFAYWFYYTIYQQINFNIINKISGINQMMMASVVAFYFLYYFLAYKLTDIKLSLDGNDTASSDNEKDGELKTD